MYCVSCLRRFEQQPAPGVLPLCTDCTKKHAELDYPAQVDAGVKILGLVEQRRHNETMHRAEASLSDVLQKAARRSRS